MMKTDVEKELKEFPSTYFDTLIQAKAKEFMKTGDSLHEAERRVKRWVELSIDRMEGGE